MGRVSLFFICFSVLAFSHVACINYFPEETFAEIMEHAQSLRESIIFGEDFEALRNIQSRLYEGGDVDQRKYLVKEALKLYTIVTPLLKRQFTDAKQIQTRINELPYRASPKQKTRIESHLRQCEDGYTKAIQKTEILEADLKALEAPEEQEVGPAPASDKNEQLESRLQSESTSTASSSGTAASNTEDSDQQISISSMYVYGGVALAAVLGVIFVAAGLISYSHNRVLRALKRVPSHSLPE